MFNYIDFSIDHTGCSLLARGADMRSPNVLTFISCHSILQRIKWVFLLAYMLITHVGSGSPAIQSIYHIEKPPYVYYGDTTWPKPSPTDDRIVFGGSSLWDLETGALVDILPYTSTNCIFMPNGKTLLTSDLAIWDISKRQKILKLPGHTRALGPWPPLACSMDGSKVLSSDPQSNAALLWDTATRSVINRFDTDSPVTAVAFSPTGTEVIVGHSTGSERWSLETGEAFVFYPSSPNHSVDAVEYSPDGKYILTRDNHRTTIWDAETSSVMIDIRTDFIMYVKDAHFSHDGSKVLMAKGSQSVGYLSDCEIWDMHSLSLIRTISFESPIVYTCQFNASGSKVVAGLSSFGITVWDIESGAGSLRIADLPCGSGRYHQSLAAFSSDGNVTILGGMSGDHAGARAWNTYTGQFIGEFRHEGAYSLYSLAMSPDGSTLATGDDDGAVKIWDFLTGVEKKTLVPYGSEVRALAFSPDGRKLAIGVGNRLYILDIASGDLQLNLLLEEDGNGDGEVVSVEFSPDGSRIAVAQEGGSGVWDVESGENIRRFGQAYLTSVSYSPDGRRIATGSVSGGAKIYNLDSGSVHRTIDERNRISSVDFSSNGEMLFTGDKDGIARIWDVNTGAVLSQYKDRSYDDINAVLFSPIKGLGLILINCKAMLFDLFPISDDEFIQSLDYNGNLRIDDPDLLRLSLMKANGIGPEIRGHVHVVDHRILFRTMQNWQLEQ